MSALQTFKGAEAFVSCRLSDSRKKFDKQLARGRNPSLYAGAVIPAERAEYVRDELRSALFALTSLLHACETVLGYEDDDQVPEHVLQMLRINLTLFRGEQS